MPIRLRISLNTGPCIAVRLNANADFFGSTVNVAAKLQALAEAYQIAMSEATFRSAGVAEFLGEQQATLDELTYESKALKEVVKVRRYLCDRAACHTTVGGVVVYKDEQHLTATFARTLAPLLAPALRSLVGELRRRPARPGW